MSTLKEVMEDIDAMLLKEKLEENRLLEEEILNEGNVVQDKRNGYCIVVNDDSGNKFRTLPYFKFKNLADYKRNDKVARIPIVQHDDKPDKGISYQIHKHGLGKHFDLKSRDFDVLEELLRTKTDMGIVWDEIIEEANNLIMSSPAKDNEKWLIPKDTPIPDYRNLLRKVN